MITWERNASMNLELKNQRGITMMHIIGLAMNLPRDSFILAFSFMVPSFFLHLILTKSINDLVDRSFLRLLVLLTDDYI